VLNKEDYKMIVEIEYDKGLLKEQVHKLSFFDSSKIIEPKNASYKYIDNGYVIVEEVLGNKGNKEILDGSIINKWLKVDDNNEVVFNEKQVEIYVDGLARGYNTVAKSRNFVTTSGKVIKWPSRVPLRYQVL